MPTKRNTSKAFTPAQQKNVEAFASLCMDKTPRGWLLSASLTHGGDMVTLHPKTIKALGDNWSKLTASEALQLMVGDYESETCQAIIAKHTPQAQAVEDEPIKAVPKRTTSRKPAKSAAAASVKSAKAKTTTRKKTTPRK